MSDKTIDYTKLFENAEKAVSGIKNEKLREIAFEKLVNHLLSGNSDNPIDEERKVEKSKRKKTTTAGSASKISKDGPKAWLSELVREGFFKKPKSSSDIREELESRSHHLKATDLTNPLQTLCHDKLLRRKKVAHENGGKSILHWVNW